MSNKDDLLSEIEKYESILSLENNIGFINFINYFKESARIADEVWQNYYDANSKEFTSLKISKIAALNVLKFLDNAKFELEILKQEYKDLTEQ